ncbi:hypothetical protein G9A89_011809 [Geosiphon pyriformis]|nr:hypothetical protein G9A89_011809 [Geosiphon pyriformis]
MKFLKQVSTTFKKRDQKPLVTFGALPWKQHSKNNFKVATTPDATTLEYYQSIYTHCKQKFNIPDGIEVVKKSVYQYIENCINNYLFGNYNISEIRSNLYNNLAHYLQLGTEDLNSETLATYFHELNFTLSNTSQYTIDFESETETSNKGKNKLKQYSKTTPNTPTLPKITANYLQTPEQGTKDFTSFGSLIRQQEPLQTSSNLLDFLTENQSEHSETAANKENKPEIFEEESIDSENEEDEMTTYIAKISEFNGEDIETSLQEWLDQVTKAGDANRWNAARMLRTILYFLKGTVGEWFENLAAPFNDWNAFKAVFLKQFTDNNTSIILHKLIKKVRPHMPEDLNSAIQHMKRYEMAMEEANRTKLVNLAIGETSSAAEKKIDQLTKKDFHHTAPLEGRAAAQQQNSSYTLTTIPPARIAENANLSDIFPFEFEANESPFLPSNAAANEQKTIMAMYIEAEVKGKTIRLILDSRSAGSIITYQLMQQLKRNVDQPAQTVIVTADGMKKIPVEEIDNFLFTLDGITIPVKVLVMDAPQYQALLTIFYQRQHAWVSATCGTFNKRSEKASAFEFEPEEEKPLIKTFMALGSMSNWADETEQEHFTPHSEPETSG